VLQGTLRDNWHLYAFKQKENGPTPLRVALDANEVAQPDGAPRAARRSSRMMPPSIWTRPIICTISPSPSR
jgi:hypothetical protein